MSSEIEEVKRAFDLGPVNPDNEVATQRLYRMDPPLQGHEYVVVSAANPQGALFETVDLVASIFGRDDDYEQGMYGSGPETFIFPANGVGDITDFGELPGSFKGDMDHERAVRNAGYEVVAPVFAGED